MSGLRSRFSERPWLLPFVLALLIGGAAFATGYVLADDAGEVTDLKAELAKAEDGRERARSERADSVIAEGEQAQALEDLEEELQAERSLSGKGNSQEQAAAREYDTDYDWGSAGNVGYLVVKPTGFRKEGSRWILEVEAKNEASEPKTPFCGDAGAALGDASGNTYTGEAVISETSDSCEELQPGLTGTYAAEFKMPEDAMPIIAGVYGDWEQEEEAKFWELPK